MNLGNDDYPTGCGKRASRFITLDERLAEHVHQTTTRGTPG